MDLSGLDASPDELAALLDVLSEPDTYNGYDEDQAAADQVGAMSDSEFAELLAEYEADQQLPGPELAGADVGGVIDLAGDGAQLDLMLATMTNREAVRQREDQAGVSRRGTSEVRLMAGMARVQAGTYLYGQEPAGTDLANWQGGGSADDLFGTSPALNAAEVADHMRYQLSGGAKPQGRGRFTPPVRDLARQIGLR